MKIWKQCTEWVCRKFKVMGHFTKIIIDFLEEQSAAGGADAETLQLTTELTPEQIEETTGMTVAASPARKKKLPFYIAPGKLDEVELTDTCMISELTNRINELCNEEDQKNRKKLTAAFVNTLLIQKGYIEEATEGEEKVKTYNRKRKRSRDTGRRTIWQIWKKVLRINSYEGESGDDFGRTSRVFG